MKINKSLFVLASVLLSTSSRAETWAVGTCTAWTGEIVKYAVHEGRGYISYDNGSPQQIFTKYDGKFIILMQIGDHANLSFAIDPKNGRGYAYAKSDKGEITEGNITCSMSSMEK